MSELKRARPLGPIGRVEAYWTAGRTAAAIIALLAVAQIVAFAPPESGSLVGRIVALATAPLLLIGALLTFRRPTRQRLWVLATVTCVQAALHLSDSRATKTLAAVGQYLFVFTLLLLMIVAVACGLFRASPFKLAVAVGSMFVTLLVFIILLSSDKQTGLEQGYIWSESIYEPDPDLEYRLLPCVCQRIYYPENPRNYFETQSSPNRLDSRLFFLSVNGGASATFSAAGKETGAFGVQNIKASPPEGWRVIVGQRGLLLSEPGRWIVRYEGRADSPRPLEVSLNQPGPTPRRLGEPCFSTLNTQWTMQQANFDLPESSTDVRLEFQVGQSETPLEIRDVTLDGPAGSAPIFPAPYFVTYRTNSAGFRDQERTIPKPPGVFRIACLGDSFTFGQGVKAADRFTDRLERRLNERYAGEPKFEVLNFGLCGYSTRQELNQYRKIVRAYQPDLVLVSMVTNDNMSPDEEKAIDALTEGPDSGGVLSLRRISRMIDAYGRRRDYSRCIADFHTLDETCQKDKARLAIIFFRLEPLNRTASSVRPHLKPAIPVLDLYPALRSVHSFNDIAVTEKDGHPNELANQIAAETIESFLTDNSLLPKPPPAK